MKSPLAVPRWIEENLDPERLLRLPHMPPILLYHGINSISYDNIESMTWTCCATYRIKVNGGGLLAGQPLEPEPYAPGMSDIEPWGGLEELARWLGVSLEKGFVNPLSTTTSTPLIMRRGSPPQCVEYGEYRITAANLTPLKFYREADSCREPSSSSPVQVRLGDMRVRIENGKTLKSGDVVIHEAGSCLALFSKGSVILLGSCRIDLETPYLEHEVWYLSGVGYTPVRGRRLRLENVQAAWVGLEKFVAVGSKDSFNIEVKPGTISLESEVSLRISLGRGLAAYRIMLEDSILWRPIYAPERGFGHVRSSYSLVVVSGGRGVLEYSVVNPTTDQGVVEVRLPFWGSEATVRGPLGETSIPIAGDLFRIPAPPGFVGLARVVLSGKKLWMLRLASRRG